MSFIKTLVRSFTKPHTSSEGGSSTTIYVGGGNTNYDNNNLNVVNVNANTASINNLNAKNIKVDNIKSDYIDSRAANIGTVYGDTLAYSTGNIDDLTSSDIKTSKLNVTDTATINNLIAEYMQSKDIVTDNLTVNKTAHFFELIIDKINSVGGTIINTAANCSLDYVEAYDQNDEVTDIDDTAARYYRCYWKSTNAEGKAVDNKWKPNDQAICQSFNVATGVNHNVSNKYYWRLVNATDLSNSFNLSTRFINLNDEYDFDNKVLDAATDYILEFSNGFIFTDGITTVNLTAESYEGSDFDDENNVLTVHAVGDAIKIYGYDTNDDSDIILSDGDIVFDTDIHAKMSLIAVYDDGTVEYSSEDTYETYHSFTIPTDKNISYLLARVDTVEVWDECNWIDLSNTDKDGSSSAAQDQNNASIPGRGDDVCQLGYRYGSSTDPDEIARASAIIIAAYKTPDAGVNPPSYAQYQDITDYNLSIHRKTYFDATGGHIIGDFQVVAGGNQPVSLEDYIKSFNTANPCDIVVATNYTDAVDIIILQSDSSSHITDINNFPSNLQVTPRVSGSGAYPGAYTYNTFNLSLFGVTYDLLNFDNTNPTQYLPSGYEGIYLKSVFYSSYRYYNLTFDFIGTSQTVGSTSLGIYVDLTHVSSSNNYSYTKSIPVNSVSSVQGTDAEVYHLFKDTEIAEVRNSIDQSGNIDGRLYSLLRYSIIHVVGTTAEFVQPPTGFKITVDSYNINNQLIDSAMDNTTPYPYSGGKSGLGYWEFFGTSTRWWTAAVNDREAFFLVRLFNADNECVDSSVVTVNVASASLFSVEEGITTSIQAEATTRGQQYSQLTQRVDGINSTVVNQQTQIGTINSNINTINGDITDINGDISTINSDMNTMRTDISTIDQKADSISLHVDTVETNLDTFETDLQTTGIDIENGKINLNADNTNINGNLNVYNAKQGIIVYDSNNNPKISITADNLGGSYDSYSTNIGQTYDNWYESTTQKPANTASYIAPIVQVTLGNLKNNTELIFSTSIGSTDWYNENNYIDAFFYTTLIDGNYSHIVSGGTISGATYSFTFSNGSTTITRSGNFTISNDRLYLPNINVTLTADGNWIMSGSISLTLTGVKQSLASYYCGHQVFYIKGADPAVNKISLDGMLIKPSNNNVNWFGSDMTVLSNGLHEVRVTSNGIKERNYINSNTGIYNENPISCSQKVQMVYNDGTSINDDTTFVLIGNNVNPISVLLPQSTGNNYIEGRTIYIKNNSTQPHNIVANWNSASLSRVIPKDKTLSDVASSSAYDYGRYWTIPAKSQITVVCVHNEDMSVPLWYVF